MLTLENINVDDIIAQLETLTAEEQSRVLFDGDYSLLKAGEPTVLDKFAALFPCRYQWSSGVGNAGGIVGEWYRRKGYLDDRQLLINWRDRNEFVSVCFDGLTQYLVLDIDAGSQYCWQIGQASIEEALQPIGVETINWYKSSASGGLHGYIVFSDWVNSFWGAVAVKRALVEAGLTLRDGELEIMPNVRSYNSPFKTHRLPCQVGFGCSVERFLEDWEFAAGDNSLDVFLAACEDGKAWLKKQKLEGVKSGGGSASKLYKDLQAVIQEGWTGAGQTNFVMGRIAYFHRVFTPEADTVEKLTELIENTARECPGFYLYCGHQEQVGKKSMEWARSAWKKYTPYAENPEKAKRDRRKPAEENKDVQRTKATRDRIAAAVETLKSEGKKVTQRAVAELVGMSQPAVRKHVDLLK